MKVVDGGVRKGSLSKSLGSGGRWKGDSEEERRGEGQNYCCCGPESQRVWKVGLDLNVVEVLLKEESTFGRGRSVEGTLANSRSGAGRRGDLREPPVKGSDPVSSVEEGVVVGLHGKALWIVVIEGICAPNAIEGWRRRWGYERNGRKKGEARGKWVKKEMNTSCREK